MSGSLAQSPATAYPNPISLGSNATQALSAAAAFGSNNTAGNVIVALVFGANSNTAGVAMDTPTVTDSQGNTYTQLYFLNGGNGSGGPVGVYVATGIKAGANTVAFTVQCHTIPFSSGTFDAGIIAYEVQGMGPAATVQGVAQHFYGTAGDFPQSLSLTDTYGVSVSMTFWGTLGGTGGFGTDSSIALAMISGLGANMLIGGMRSYEPLAHINVPFTTPTGYQLFGATQQEPRADAGDNLYYWGPVSPIPTITQPQVFVVT